MGFLIDLHVHTSRYSECSRIPAEKLIDQAVRAGLDGVVITEHHYQWPVDELRELLASSRHPGFLLLSGFEYTSCQGDILVYGVEAKEVARFVPRWQPEEAAELATELGGVCVAAHPTRAGLSFDARIATLPLAAIEVCSVNLQHHERKLAEKLAASISKPGVACSDAHDLQNVGRYSTEFDALVTCSADLQNALRHGRFHINKPRDERQ